MGMANQRDGGLVVIGVSETADGLEPVGVSTEDLASWTYEGLVDELGRFTDPSVHIDFEVRTYLSLSFAVIRVREFEDVPIICKRDLTLERETVLREGACYVRSRRRTESTDVRSQEDMRALLDLAVEKKLQAFMSLAVRAGIVQLKGVPGEPGAHEGRFDSQGEDLLK